MTVNVVEETKMLNFTTSFEDDLAVLQASGSNKSQRKAKATVSRCENFEVNLKIYFRAHHGTTTVCYKTIGLWFKLCVYRVMDALGSFLSTQEDRVAIGDSYVSFLLSNLPRASITR